MATLTLDDVVVQNRSTLAAVAGGEILALNEASGFCFALGGSALPIWQSAEHPIAVAAICATLRQRYDIDEQACATQTLAYIERLVDEELFVRSPRAE